MKNEIERYSNKTFEDIKHIDKNGNEFWYARELQVVLEYKEWRKFNGVIQKAIIACENSGISALQHFVGTDKLSKRANNAEVIVQDYKLTRYACYLIAQNGDSRKKVISLAQTYFAVQTRKQELKKPEYEQLSDDEIVFRALNIMNDKIKKLEQENVVKENLIKEYEPKITYLDQILASKDLINITVIAKDYGMSAKAFNQLLADNKIQYKVGKQWFLYSEYQDKGYTSSYTQNIEINGETKVVVAMKWTQQGRLFLYNFLKEQDVVPLIERNLAVQLSLV